MTHEIFWLTLTLILAASLWVPYIIGVNLHPQTGVDDFTRPPPLTGFPNWVHRAHRAHLNMIETLVPFAGLVLIAHLLGISTGITVVAAATFFWLRLAHAAGMISGVARFPLRPLLFTASWACSLLMAWQIMAHG